jgi:hypothetical protein
MINEPLYLDMGKQAHLTLETILTERRVRPDAINPYTPHQIQEIKDEMTTCLNAEYDAHYAVVDMEYMGFDGEKETLTKFEDRKKRTPTVLVYHWVACLETFDLRLAAEYVNGRDVNVIRYRLNNGGRMVLGTERFKRSKAAIDNLYAEFNICNDKPNPARLNMPSVPSVSGKKQKIDRAAYKNNTVQRGIQTSLDRLDHVKKTMWISYLADPLPEIKTGGNYIAVEMDFFIDGLGAADILLAEMDKRHSGDRS